MFKFVIATALLCSTMLNAQTPIPFAKLSSPDVYKYVETGYFAATLGNNGKMCTENLSGAYQQSIVIDEAHIVKVVDNEVFFELILRQHVSNDQPCTQIKFKVNGDRVYPVDEIASAKDYAYESERVVTSIDNYGILGSTNVTTTEKEERIYRVIERKITFSHVFAKGIPSKIKITLAQGITQADYLSTAFLWKIVK
jgi:hypothetical protein